MVFIIIFMCGLPFCLLFPFLLPMFIVIGVVFQGIAYMDAAQRRQEERWEDN
jgi:hypothetical protein